MPLSVLVTLDQFSEFPLKEIGSKARELTHLASYQIPIPKTVCLTRSTLEEIAKANKLGQAIKKLIPRSSSTSVTTDIRHRVYQLIKTQSLPSDLSKELLKELNTTFSKKDFVQITTSHINSPSSGASTYLTGDAAILEAVLTLWAETVMNHLQRTPNAEDEFLVPSAILIQEQPQPVASGIAFTRHPSSGSKSHVYLQSVWGALHPDSREVFDSFEINIHSWDITSQHLHAQEREYLGSSAGLEAKLIPRERQTKPSLSKRHVQQLAQLIRQVKQRYLEHKEIHWVFDGNKFYVVHIQDMPHDVMPHTLHLHPTKTQLLISAGNPHRVHEYANLHHDGVLIRSDYTFVHFGYHPHYALKSKHDRELLAKDLYQTVKTFQHTNPSQLLLYRSLDLNSKELRHLLHSEGFEPLEHNSEIGFRGGLKIINQPEVFQLELQVLHKILEQTEQPLVLVVPYLRRPTELLMIHELVKRAGLLDFPHFQFWWQINTPENILNVAAYPLQKVHGITVNLQSIHNLVTGVDGENDDVATNYSYNSELLTSLLQTLMDTLSQKCATQEIEQKPKVFVQFSQFNRTILENAIALGATGVIVKPAVAPHAKVCIMDTEG